jgi:hypothetical protein
MVYAAVPPDSDAVPRTVEPAMNVTVPVGVDPETAFTVAEIATGWPSVAVEGVLSVVAVVMGAAAATVIDTAEEVEEPSVLLPP